MLCSAISLEGPTSKRARMQHGTPGSTRATMCARSPALNFLGKAQDMLLCRDRIVTRLHAAEQHCRGARRVAMRMTIV